MHIPGLSPTRHETENSDGTWTVKVVPPKFMNSAGASVRLTEDQYQRYKKWLDGGPPIQTILPELRAADREILMSGLDDAAFQELYPDDNDD